MTETPEGMVVVTIRSSPPPVVLTIVGVMFWGIERLGEVRGSGWAQGRQDLIWGSGVGAQGNIVQGR